MADKNREKTGLEDENGKLEGEVTKTERMLKEPKESRKKTWDSLAIH